MWQRKSTKEIRPVALRLRFSPLYALGFSLFAATVMTVAMSWGFRGHLLSPFPPVTLSRAFRALPFYFMFMFLGLYLTQILRRIPKIPDRAAMICDQCHEVTDYTTDPHCSCGEHLELLAHWRWVPGDEKRPSYVERTV